MAAEDVAQALMALESPKVRQLVAGGDFGPLGTLSLTVAEQQLISEATPMLPSGHLTKVLVRVGAGVAETTSLELGKTAGYWPAGTARAIQYVQTELKDPRVQARFIAWQRSVMDEFP